MTVEKKENDFPRRASRLAALRSLLQRASFPEIFSSEHDVSLKLLMLPARLFNRQHVASFYDATCKLFVATHIIYFELY